jgi:hypothetical protein
MQRRSLQRDPLETIEGIVSDGELSKNIDEDVYGLDLHRLR